MAGLDLGDISAYERMLYGNVEDDPDLEAELLAIQNEIGDEDDDDASVLTRAAASSSSRKPQHVGAGRPNAMADIDRLAKQISQEINVADDENDESVDDDPELLAELSALDDEDAISPAQAATGASAKTHQNVAGRQHPGESGRDLIVLIEDRLTNYKAAQRAAKEAGDAAKLRRLDRGIAVSTLCFPVMRGGF